MSNSWKLRNCRYHLEIFLKILGRNKKKREREDEWEVEEKMREKMLKKKNENVRK